MGFPVEFLREEHIFQKYGENGITRYTKARFSGKALISDETQMSLLTTNGLLVWEPRTVHRTQDRPRADVMRAMTG
ncbi:MAG: ADP-ribosylglycohydrolase family protein [Clostridia bacterium]|nr:ADP-ribosylglycohydrolase family protein [Clostridia bacterium]